jgi:hypothetical protein
LPGRCAGPVVLVPAVGHRRTPLRHGEGMHFTISCDTCSMRDSHACADCIVPMLCGESPDGAIVFDIEEMRTINVMAKVGLVPTLRHRADDPRSMRASGD